MPSVTDPVKETILPFVTVGAVQVSVTWWVAATADFKTGPG